MSLLGRPRAAISQRLRCSGFFQSSFSHSVMILFTGTAVAQGITLLVSPVLTRLYSPAAFGIYALFIAIITILTSVAAGKYEMAVLLPEKDEDGLNLVFLACCITLCTGLAVLLIVFLFGRQIGRWMDAESYSHLLYCIPLMVVLSGCYSAFNFWHNRRKRYSRLSCNRIMRNVVAAGANIGMGAARFEAAGLIWGAITGQAFATGIFGWQLCKDEKRHFAAVSTRAMASQASRYRNFPKYLVASGLVEAAAGQFPIILFSALFGAAPLGFFSFALRMVSLPMGLIAESVRDVFKQAASEEYAKSGCCDKLFLVTLRQLLYLSIIPFTAIFLLGPFLFAFVFGEEWRIAGEYARIMTFPLFLRFLASPLSSTLYIAEKQKWILLLQTGAFAAVAASLILASQITRRPEIAVIAYSSVFAVKYVVELVLGYRFSLTSGISAES